MPATSSPLWTLENQLNCNWTHLHEAETYSSTERDRLCTVLGSEVPEDTSFVVFGSLARGEMTPGSDLDWTLLLDGRTDTKHQAAIRTLIERLSNADFVKPGPTGVFGSVVSSHPILNQIGGEDDTNRNTTQRILLLLESIAVGRPEAHERVRRLVIERYVEEDRGILNGRLFPQVLLNDIARYWRTITIDFVDKQKRGEGWALRNVKLRLSRKLIYISGLLTCFSLELDANKEFVSGDGKPDPARLVDFLEERVRWRPLDILADVCLRADVSKETACALFDSYNLFLGMLADESQRKELKGLTVDDLGNSTVFSEASKLARRFQQEGVHRLFFNDDKTLTDLLTRYCVF